MCNTYVKYFKFINKFEIKIENRVRAINSGNFNKKIETAIFLNIRYHMNYHHYVSFQF